MSFVYLIQAQNGVVKIGCALHPEQRLVTVKTHSPVPVRLIAMWPGHFSDERALHRQFDGCRSHLEWFRIEGDLLAFVAEVQGRGVDRILDWHEIVYVPDAAKKTVTLSRMRAKAKARWANPAFRLMLAKNKYRRDLLASVRDRALAGEGSINDAVLDAAEEQCELRFTFYGPHLPSPSLVDLAFEKTLSKRRSSAATAGAST